MLASEYASSMYSVSRTARVPQVMPIRALTRRISPASSMVDSPKSSRFASATMLSFGSILSVGMICPNGTDSLSCCSGAPRSSDMYSAVILSSPSTMSFMSSACTDLIVGYASENSMRMAIGMLCGMRTSSRMVTVSRFKSRVTDSGWFAILTCSSGWFAPFTVSMLRGMVPRSATDTMPLTYTVRGSSAVYSTSRMLPLVSTFMPGPAPGSSSEWRNGEDASNDSMSPLSDM